MFGLFRKPSTPLAPTTLGIATAKGELGWTEAFVRGILCNALVCLAVRLCNSARSVTDKILAIIWPITGFVALGFEHCIANMYFILLGILLKGDAGLAAVTGPNRPSLDALTLQGLGHNLLPVTLGNIIGGILMVAGVYWFAYLRAEKRSAQEVRTG